MPKVTVYTAAHNYGRFIRQAIESILAQTFTDWEFVIINDASTDNTAEVLADYVNHPAIRIINQTENLGLTQSANKAIKASAGDYIVRLDADDYLDENCFQIMAGYLDAHPEIGLVYPDYYHVTEDGQIIEQVRRKKLHDEVHLLDLPAHGAGTMFRRSCFDVLGGYSEDISCQDGYDLWIRFIDCYKVHNINLPLFYYRKHGSSLSDNKDKILKTRRYIKNRFIQQKYQAAKPRILAIIPVRGTTVRQFQKLALITVNGKSLLQYSLDEARATSLISRIVVTTEDADVIAWCKAHEVEVIARPRELALPKVPIEPTVFHVLKTLRESEQPYVPEIVALLHVNAPLRQSEHITEALTTLLIFNSDSVISVCEENGHFYQHRSFGLEPLFQKRLLRLEQESLYRENGAVFVSRLDVISPASFLGATVSHVVMQKSESIQIDDEFDLWIVEQILKEKNSRG